MFTEEQRDCLLETINVAMGQTGDALARLLGTFVQLTVPGVEGTERASLSDALRRYLGDADHVAAVRQGFFSAHCRVDVFDPGHGRAAETSGLRGECFVLFGDDSYRQVAELIAYEDQLDEQSERELLLDVSNLLAGACLNGLAEQLGEVLSFTPPALVGTGLAIDHILDTSTLQWDQILLIAVNYRLEYRSFDCTLVLMMPTTAIAGLSEALDRILATL